MTGIDKVIEAAGGETALGDVLGVSQQAVNKWKRRGYVPIERVDQIVGAFNVERSSLVDPKLRDALRGE